MKKIFCLIAAIGILMVNVAFTAINIPPATNEFYVNDFAGVLSEETKAKIYKAGNETTANYGGLQVVVVTVKTTDGNDYAAYSHQVYNQYGIGKDDRGALLLVVTDDRKVRIEVGRHSEGDLTDSKAGRILDNYVTPHFAEGDWDSGVWEGYRAITAVLTQNADLEEFELDDSSEFVQFIIACGTLLIIFIISLIIKKRNGGGGSGSTRGPYPPYFGGGFGGGFGGSFGGGSKGGFGGGSGFGGLGGRSGGGGAGRGF